MTYKSMEERKREQEALQLLPSYPVVIGDASIGSARSNQEALNVVAEYARDRYGWRYADGRDMIAIMVSAMDHLVQELGYSTTKDTIHVAPYEVKIGIETRVVWGITFQRELKEG
jgi:hypothetical protein